MRTSLKGKTERDGRGASHGEAPEKAEESADATPKNEDKKKPKPRSKKKKK